MAKKKPDASTERGKGAQAKSAKKTTPGSQRQGGLKRRDMTEGQRAVDDMWKASPQYRAQNVQGGLKRSEMTRGQKKVYDRWSKWSAGQNSNTQNPADPEDTVTDAEQDLIDKAEDTRIEMDWYLRNAWPDKAVRDKLTSLLAQAVKDRRINANSENVYDQVWGVLEETPEYAARFPGLMARKNKGANGQVPMSPTDYMKMEDLFAMNVTSKGIPADVFNQRDVIAKLVENDVTVQEMQQRIDMAAAAAVQDESFMKKFTEYRGMTPGHLIAFYLDPDMTAENIAKTQRVMEVGAMMDRYKFKGALSDAQALESLGLTDDSVMSSLDRAARQRGLMSGLGSTASESELIQGSATDGDQSQALAQIRAQRQARFNQSGGAAETQRGVSGLGKASTT